MVEVMPPVSSVAAAIDPATTGSPCQGCGYINIRGVVPSRI